MIVKGGRAAPCMWEGGCGHAARVNFGAPPWGGPRWRAKTDEFDTENGSFGAFWESPGQPEASSEAVPGAPPWGRSHAGGPF